MIPARIPRSVPLLLAAGLLTGCISLLPESEPVQLYRFGGSVPQANGTQSAAPGFTVLLVNASFNSAAAGDRILTMSGAEASYIKGARWVTNAQDLFHAALRQAFTHGGRARLVDSGDVGRPGYALKLQVYAFEARYTRGLDAPPDILVALQATLTETDGRVMTGQRAFSASVPASENRVGAIVAAFDQAVAQVTGELAAWVDARESTRGTREDGP